MVLINDEDDMATALCIIIIIGVLRTRLVNRNPTRRSCWVRPWIRRYPKFGAFHALLATEDPQSFRTFF